MSLKISYTLLLSLIIIFSNSCNFSKKNSDPSDGLTYSTCKSWEELIEKDHYQYVKLERISDPGTKENPRYTGFWFYDEFQFDPTDRYLLGMKTDFTDREVQANDIAEIGYFDLK